MAGPPLHPCHLRTGQDTKETCVHGKFAVVAEVRAGGSLELSPQPPARREPGGPGPGLCRRLSWAGRPDPLDSWTLAPCLLPPGLPGGGTLADDSDSSPGFSGKRDGAGHEVGAGLGISRGNSGSKSSLRGSLEKSPHFVEGVKRRGSWSPFARQSRAELTWLGSDVLCCPGLGPERETWVLGVDRRRPAGPLAEPPGPSLCLAGGQCLQSRGRVRGRDHLSTIAPALLGSVPPTAGVPQDRLGPP